MNTLERPARGVVAAAAIAVMFVAGDAVGVREAHGQVLRNRDDVVHSVTVRAKSMRRRLDIAPGEAIRDFCGDGCVIRLDEDEDRDFLIEGNERLSIEVGLVYFDGEIVGTPEGDVAAGSADGARKGTGAR